MPLLYVQYFGTELQLDFRIPLRNIRSGNIRIPVLEIRGWSSIHHMTRLDQTVELTLRYLTRSSRVKYVSYEVVWYIVSLKYHFPYLLHIIYQGKQFQIVDSHDACLPLAMDHYGPICHHAL